MTVRWALFDLDGTLVDSEPGIVGSLERALATVGLPVPARHLLRTAIGPPFESGLPAIGVPASQVPVVTAAYRAVYEEEALFEATVYDGVPGMLAALAAAGCTLSVATSKPEPTARRLLEHVGLTDNFAVIGGATYEAGRRTKAAVIAHVLAQLGPLNGSRPVMVGDRSHDIDGARAHGLETIAVAWGFGDPAEHAAAGAWAIAERPADVVDLILNGAAR